MTINVRVNVTSAPNEKALRVEESYSGTSRVLTNGESVDLVVHDANEIKLSEVAVEQPPAATPAPEATAGATGTD